MKNSDKVLAAMRVDKKNSVKLGKIDPDSTEGMKDKKEARDALAENTAKMNDLQFKLYAENKRSLLVVFQAMDTAGKDGVIRKVFGPLNPQGVVVSAFKRPTPLEMAHDYLWRIHACAPAKGMIGIFNRSHYEDVLVRRVHQLDKEEVIEERYKQLGGFEKFLAANDTVILKFFLHISKDEQKKRLQARLDDPDRRWKFEIGDLAERKLWDAYQAAYQLVLDNCAHDYAPWYVIPANNKWYRDWAVSSIILKTLKDMNPKFPAEAEGLDKVKID